MAEAIRKLFGVIKLKDQASKEARKVDNSMDEAKKSAIGLQESLQAIGGAVFVRQIAGIVGEMLEVAGTFEQTAISFEVMLGGNVAKSQELIKNLEDMSLKTPFTPEALQENAKLLLNFGTAAKDIMPTLQMLGDISGGNRVKLNGMTLAFSQSMAVGRLMGQDLLQMINQGFNPLQVIAKKTGKTMKTLKDEMSKGLISFDMVKDAFKIATSEGGKFFGMMARQAKSWKGLVSTFEGFKGQIFKEIGTIFIETFKPILEFINQLSGDFVKWVKASEQNLSILKTGVLALSVAVGVILVAAFKTLAVTIFTALAPVIIPLLLITAAVTAIILIVDDLIVGFQGGEAVIFGFFGTIKDEFNNIVNWVMKSNSFIAQFIKLISRLIIDTAKLIIEIGLLIFDIGKIIFTVFSVLIKTISSIMSFVFSITKNIIIGMIDFLKPAIDLIGVIILGTIKFLINLFGSIVKTVKTMVINIRDVIKTLPASLSKVGKDIIKTIFPIKDIIKFIKKSDITIWKSIQFIAKMFWKLPSLILGLGIELLKMMFPFDVVVDWLDEFLDFFKSIPDRILNTFERLGTGIVNFMSGILPEWVIKLVGKVEPGSQQGGITGKRAEGGPVTAGGTFLVGENGPELLSMGENTGFVSPSVKTGGVHIESLIKNLSITVQGAQEVGEEIKTVVLDALNDLSRNILPSEFGVTVT